ncbi:SapB/AmfS family lanthipeptide [Streptomyces palmae]|uniref:SapB/AmfS family lantipeptide n=1 Tax=Streptomyces palmae TaxID=1701085 RepID=A0A4Z0H6K8_9ACTN|nr:SapB/AmfS family lanthipeptide [Streptomyces palmae]TGB06054.1 SapB/AmfS family lantipeptide [Streptomyces palmae]
MVIFDLQNLDVDDKHSGEAPASEGSLLTCDMESAVSILLCG